MVILVDMVFDRGRCFHGPVGHSSVIQPSDSHTLTHHCTLELACSTPGFNYILKL